MSEHSHPVLPWYDYDDIAHVEVLKAGKVFERFESYETEEDIKRTLRDMGYTGTFEVRGLDDNLRPLPQRGEIVVSTGRGHLSNLLRKASHVKYAETPNKQGPNDKTEVVLEHLRQRETSEERERREKERRLEQLYERQNIERQQALEERKAEQERLLERERELERERAERIEREAREAAERAKREAEEMTSRAKMEAREAREAAEREAERRREEMERRERQVREEAQAKIAALDQMYKAQLDNVKQSSAQEASMLSTALSAQVSQANTQAEIWRQKYESIAEENKRLQERLAETRREAIEEIDKEKRRTAERYEDKERDLVSRTEAQIAAAQKRYEDKEAALLQQLELKEATYKQRIELLEEQREEAKEKIRQFELKMVQMDITSQIDNAPSHELRETLALIEAGAKHGLDTGKILEQKLGLQDAKKEEKSAINKMIEGMLPTVLPAMAQQFTGKDPKSLPSGNNSAKQGSDSSSDSGSVPAGTTQSKTFPGATVKRL